MLYVLYGLLWVVLLATSVLVTAFVASGAARLSGRVAPIFLCLGGFVVAALPGLAATFLAWFFAVEGVHPDWRAYTTSWSLAVAAGGFAVCFLALRRGREDERSRRGTRWSVRGLAIQALSFVLLSGLTFVALDIRCRSEVRQIYERHRALVESLQLSRPPDENNAALLYVELHEAIGDEWQDDWYTRDWLCAPTMADFDPTDDDADEFLAETQRAWEITQAAAERSRFFPPPGEEEPEPSVLKKFVSPGFDLVQAIQGAATLASFRARIHARRGEVEECQNCIEIMGAIRAHAHAWDSAHVGLLLWGLLSDDQAQTVETVLGEAPLGARAALARAIPAERMPRGHAENALRLERSAWVAATAGAVLGEEGFEEWTQEVIDVYLPTRGVRVDYRVLLAPFRVFFGLWGVRDLEHRSARVLGLAKSPYSEVCDALAEFDQPRQKDPQGYFTRILLPGWATRIRTIAEQEAMSALVQLGLAATLYREKHGEYPKEVAVLTGESLDAVPLDPLTGKPFEATARGDGLVLYSEAATVVIWDEEESAGWWDRGPLSFCLGEASMEKRRHLCRASREEGE